MAKAHAFRRGKAQACVMELVTMITGTNASLQTARLVHRLGIHSHLVNHHSRLETPGALQGRKTVRLSKCHAFDAVALAVRKVVQRRLADAKDTLERSHPEEPRPVLRYIIDYVVHQTVPRGACDKTSVFQAGHSAIDCSDPDRPGALRIQRANRVGRQPVTAGEALGLCAVAAKKPVAICANPQIAGGVLCHDRHVQGGRRIRKVDRAGYSVLQPRQTVHRSLAQPKCPPGILEERRHRRVPPRYAAHFRKLILLKTKQSPAR